MKRRSKAYEHPTLFISGNIARRVPLFRLWPEANTIFLENLEFYRKKYRFKLHGFVLMPDHFHLLLTVRPGTSLTDLLRDLKSAVGNQVVKRLRQSRRLGLLRRFRLPHTPRRRKDPHYRVLQYDTHIFQVFSSRVFRGKLDYMHNNPVQKRLVERVDEWTFSSWRAYADGQGGPIPIDKA